MRLPLAGAYHKSANLIRSLGPVEIHREFITAAQA